MEEGLPDKHESAYAGRWIARVQGRIVGHGGTPKQARLAAGASRHKEKPEILFVKPLLPLKFSELIQQVLPYLGTQEVYLAGGAVRDALMGRESHDFDFAVSRDAIQLARQVAKGLQADFYVLDGARDTARVIVKDANGARDVLDFAAYRGADIDGDLAGRDFTINAMAYDPRNETVLDPLGGANDLRGKLIRACSDRSIADDPIRILRGLRQAAAFGFRIEPGTRRAMRDASGLLTGVSPERQRDEIFRILDGPRPETVLKGLQVLGSLPDLLPELVPMKGTSQSSPHVFDVWDHTLAVIRHLGGIFTILGRESEVPRNADVFAGMLALQIGRFGKALDEHFHRRLTPDRSLRALLFLAALYHDVSKPDTRTVAADGKIRFSGHEDVARTVVAQRAARYNLSNDETSRIETVVGNHMRFNNLVDRMQTDQELPTRRAIYRFFRATGDAGLDLVLLGLGDQWGMREETLDQDSWEAALAVARILLENWIERPQETIRPPQLMDGHDVMREYSLRPGPIVGAMLEAIREAQATGEIQTLTEALAFGRQWLAVNQA